MSSCSICCENYNSLTRKCIICPYCSFECCSICSRTYILNEKVSTCMDNSCKKEWTRKFMVESFPKSWVNKEWKEMKMEKEVEIEKSLLPATQLLLQSSKKKNPNGKEDTFHRKCSIENCRGYLSSQWKCGLCSSYTCKDCHLEKKEGHICNKELVATISFLEEDTKPCPKCSTPIHKIDGCDQMWCTICHTAFSWRRGTIETRIHNPHYYEWLRNGGGNLPRNDGDYECGRNLESRNLIYSLMKVGSLQLNDIKEIHNLKCIPNTNLFYFSCDKGCIYLFDIEKKEIKKKLGNLDMNHTIKVDKYTKNRIQIPPMNSIQYIPSLHSILISSTSKMELWDIETGEKIKTSSNEQLNHRILYHKNNIFSVEKNVPRINDPSNETNPGYFNRLCIYNLNLELESSIDFYEDIGKDESTPIGITILEKNDFFIKNSYHRECELWNYKTGLKIRSIKNTSGGTRIVSIPNTTNILYQDNSNSIQMYNYETDIYLNHIYVEDRIQKIILEKDKIYIRFPTNIFIYSMDLTLLKKISGYKLIDVNEKIITERQGYYHIFHQDTYEYEKKIRYFKTYIPNKNLVIGKRNNILYFTKMGEIDPIEIIQKTSHLENVEGNKFRTQNQINNEKIRLDYLRGKLSEEEFGRKINMAYKAYEKKQDLKSVLDLQVQGVTDIMYRLSAENKNMEMYLKEVEELTKYSNSLFKEYAKIYGCKEWKINYKIQKVLE